MLFKVNNLDGLTDINFSIKVWSHSGLKRAFVSEVNMRELLHASQRDDVDGTEQCLATLQT